ncbi:MAG TPA: hypothetical protein VF362_02440 [Demequinaceae bacterium]
MNEKKVLGSIRKYTLWAVLGSAALLLVLEILKAWDVVKTTSGGGMANLADAALSALMGGSLDALGGLNFSAPTVNAWGHIEDTLGIIVGIGALVLLVLLVSSRTKVGKIKDGKGKAGKVAAAKVAVVTVTAPAAKAPVAKAPAAKAAAAEPKK